MNRMVSYSDGKFWGMPELEWYKPAPEGETANIDELLKDAGCRLDIHEFVGPEGASVKVWKTPDDKILVSLMNGKTEIASVLIARQTDLLPFYINYVIPFIQAHATMQLNSRVEKIENILIRQGPTGHPARCK